MREINRYISEGEKKSIKGKKKENVLLYKGGK